MSIIGGSEAGARGARGGGDLLSLDWERGVLGDLGGVEVGVCGVLRGGESAVGVPGVPGLLLGDLEAASTADWTRFRFGGSTFTPGLARWPIKASNLKLLSVGSGRTMSGRLGFTGTLTGTDTGGCAGRLEGLV